MTILLKGWKSSEVLINKRVTIISISLDSRIKWLAFKDVAWHGEYYSASLPQLFSWRSDSSREQIVNRAPWSTSYRAMTKPSPHQIAANTDTVQTDQTRQADVERMVSFRIGIQAIRDLGASYGSWYI